MRKVPFEQILASLGAALCLVTTILVWRAIAVYQSMWPAPGLYFIEISAVCVAAAALLFKTARLPGLRFGFRPGLC